VGLYTSPHLKVVQERIQINSQPLQKDLFARYVLEVWSQLDTGGLPKPRYLQLLMLVAVHTFIRENVDVAVCETHNGGEYDATNIFAHPIATGITTIGMDHVLQLGPTLENIAWHKSGIFKSGTPAFSIGQGDQATTVLRRRANGKTVSLEFVDNDTVNNSDVLAMKTTVQRKNASLAQRLANAFLRQKEPTSCPMLTTDDIRQGAEQFNWRGRFQQVIHGNHTWFLDGAHNEMSVPYAAQWFAEVVAENGYVKRDCGELMYTDSGN
jgi:folylpolyglutamate synthase